MNFFQKITVGGLTMLILSMATSTSANACDTQEVQNPQEVTCKTKVKYTHGKRTETKECKTNEEWKQSERGCKSKLAIDLTGGNE